MQMTSRQRKGSSFICSVGVGVGVGVGGLPYELSPANLGG